MRYKTEATVTQTGRYLYFKSWKDYGKWRSIREEFRYMPLAAHAKNLFI